MSQDRVDDPPVQSVRESAGTVDSAIRPVDSDLGVSPISRQSRDAPAVDPAVLHREIPENENSAGVASSEANEPVARPPQDAGVVDNEGPDITLLTRLVDRVLLASLTLPHDEFDQVKRHILDEAQRAGLSIDETDRAAHRLLAALEIENRSNINTIMRVAREVMYHVTVERILRRNRGIVMRLQNVVLLPIEDFERSMFLLHVAWGLITSLVALVVTREYFDEWVFVGMVDSEVVGLVVSLVAGLITYMAARQAGVTVRMGSGRT